MKQLYPLFSLGVMLAGAWFFFSNFQIDVSDAQSPQIRPREGTIASPTSGTSTPGNWSLPFSQPSNSAAAPRGGDTIRIASFNIQVFGEQKLSKREVVNVLANTVRNFDIVAIQEIRAQAQDIMPNFLQAINAGGRRFDYVIGERLGRSNSKEQYAYVFDTQTVEVDRRSLYTVYDPDDLLHREPLVAWFRCRAADPREAFTFSLVNVHVDPDGVSAELNVLDDVFRAVRDDGRGEDDVIMLGDFNADDRHLGHLGRMANVLWVISNTPTNTSRNAQYDNIVFDQTATREFNAHGGVYDYMREYNLSLAQAQEVSDHLPVWAEFSVYEGGVPGRVAENNTHTVPRTQMYAPNVPGYSAPAYSEPAYSQQPMYSNPGYAQQPAYSNQQGYAQPGYSQPAYSTGRRTRNPAGYSPSPQW